MKTTDLGNVLAVIFILLSSFNAYSDKVTVRLKEPKDTVGAEMTEGTMMVASQCEDCNHGFRLDQLSFFGFDKQLNSRQESFFIRNNTDRTLKGIAVYITYTTPAGNMLHKRYLKLNCEIPAGETRKADIDSWDTQKSFFYVKSAVPKRRATPFDVKFDLIAYYLEK